APEEVPREEGRRRQRRELTGGGTDAPRGALPAGRLGGGSVALDEQGEPEAAADAQGRYAALDASLRHRVEERHEDPAARRADRVAEGDRAAVDVQPVVGDLELA